MFRDLEFPSDFNVTSNARFEFALTEDSSRQESIITLLRKLSKLEKYKNQSTKIQNIFNMLSDKDVACKQYIGHLVAKDKEEMEANEEEAKKKRKEKQQAIMAKFQQVLFL